MNFFREAGRAGWVVLLDGSVKFDPCEILEVPEKVLSYYPKIENTKEKDKDSSVKEMLCYSCTQKNDRHVYILGILKPKV